MIFSDRYRFVFVHVPKCAGTSVRAAILPYHDTDDHFLKIIEYYPGLGEIDFRHLPLALLRDINPEVFKKLELYDSFALLRDPFQRFRSALAQRAKMYLGKEFAQLGEEDIRAEIDKVVTYLRSDPRVIAPEFIHFSRQSDFVHIDGQRLVHNLYPVERLDLFAAALGKHIGTDTLRIGHANETAVFRYPPLKRVARTGSGLVRRILPGSVHETLRLSARSMLMKSGATTEPAVFLEDHVRDFIEEYYAADIALHREVLANVAASP